MRRRKKKISAPAAQRTKKKKTNPSRVVSEAVVTTCHKNRGVEEANRVRSFDVYSLYSQQLLWEETVNYTSSIEEQMSLTVFHHVVTRGRERVCVLHARSQVESVLLFLLPTNLPVSNEVWGLSMGESRRHPLASFISINVHGLLIIPWLINTRQACPHSSLNKDSFIND